MRKYLSLMIVLGLFGVPPLGGRVRAEAWAELHFCAALTNQELRDWEDYSVYAAVLKERFITRDTRRLVIESSTSIDDESYADLDETVKRGAPLTKETADNFKSKHASRKLRDRFNLPLPIHLLNKKEIARVFKRRNKTSDVWEGFYRAYPSAPGLFKLSRVGFNADKSQALLFVAHSCGLLCGEGSYFVLVKKDGEWKVVKELTTWVS
jgi:hypothetical protein